MSNGFDSKDKWGLVIGDIMLDHYIIGDVKRLSPEAPVPIVNVDDNVYKIGGAGNVALNLSGLGINTFIVGEIGNDYSGEVLKDLFKENGISTKNLIKKKGATTTKTRIMGGQQQMVRLDYEELSSGPSETELKIKSIGLQPGENLHERILEEGPDSNEVEEFTIEEIKELI